MGKVLSFKPPRPRPKLVPKPRAGECYRCHHKMEIHVTHPDGSISCSARGCGCHIRSAG
ncbi:MAG: hypothetical protein ACREQI_04490 [Candidatus Binataceae bacterium]